MGRIHEDAEAKYFRANPAHRKVVQPFLNGFDVTLAERRIEKRATIVVAYLKPELAMAEFVGLDREMLLVYSPYKEFQPRTLEMHDEIKERQRKRLDPALSIIVSDDPSVKERLAGFLASDPEHPPVIAFASADLEGLSTMDRLRAELAAQFMRRDVFALDSPLTRDTMFFGRQEIVNTLLDQFRSGQNTGLFGLRRMGKTSVLYALERRIKGDSLGGFKYVDMSNPSYYRSRWPRLLEHLVRTTADGLSPQVRAQLRIKALTKSYSEDEAAAHFHRDMLEVQRAMPGQRFLLALDEIENITLGVSASPHWETDFLPFWQTLRSLHQTSRGRFCFTVAGSEPEDPRAEPCRPNGQSAIRYSQHLLSAPICGRGCAGNG